MEPLPAVEDLRLVRAIGVTGSLGGAARTLHVAQPSASQRLSRLERRVGVVLFERDTQGARPTAAGEAMIAQAAHILGHLERVFDETRAATVARTVSVGTIPSLAASVLPVLAARLDATVEQRVDHGDRLVEWVAEGTLDAAVVAIADQIVLPRGLRVHLVGTDELVLFLPAGTPPPGSGRQPLRGRRVLVATYDDSSDGVRRRLVALGADPVRAATVPTALAMARRESLAAAVPRSTLTHLHDGDVVVDLPWRQRVRLSVLTRREADQRLVAVLPALAEELGLV